MRFLHTSDWHLGRSFLGLSLLEDQAHVLGQLVDLVSEAKIDAVLLAGDVYDRSSPPADAVSLLDETLTRIVVGAGVPVVVIAGNHDNGDRLGFGSRLLTEQGLHVAGSAPRLVTLHDDYGAIDILAVPFDEPAAVSARNGGLPLADHNSALRADLAALGALCEQKKSRSSRRRVAIAHAFVAGGSPSESERPLVMGNAALVGADAFDDFAYAALGHLHRPQRVGRPEVRYSGSLLKYSFDEASHRKSVSIVEMDAKGVCTIEEVSLSARHDVRVLEGSLEEILKGGATDGSTDDYVLARLSDRGAVLDPIGKLRGVYPNCLRVQRPEFQATREERGTPRADLRSQTEKQLFEAFFGEVTGDAPDADESEAFANALAAVRRGMEAQD